MESDERWRVIRENMDLIKQAVGRLGVNGHALSEKDIQQGVCLALHGRLQRYDASRSPIRPWLVSEVRHAIKNVYRDWRGRSWSENGVEMKGLEDLEDTELEPQSPGASASVQVEGQDLWEWLLRGLDERQRLILTALYRDGLTMHEAGLAAGVSQGRASQIARACAATIRERIERRPEMAEALCGTGA